MLLPQRGIFFVLAVLAWGSTAAEGCRGAAACGMDDDQKEQQWFSVDAEACRKRAVRLAGGAWG